MPNYDYLCRACDYRFEEFHLIKDRSKPCKKPCPNCGKKKVNQYISAAPPIIDPVRLGIRRPDGGFKEVISKIKSSHPRHGMRDY